MKKFLMTLFTIMALFIVLPNTVKAEDVYPYKTIKYQDCCNGGWFKARINLEDHTAKIIKCPNEMYLDIPGWVYYGDSENDDDNYYAVTSVSKDALKKCKKTKYISVNAEIEKWNIDLKYVKKLKRLDIFSDSITSVKKNCLKKIAKKCEIMCVDYDQMDLFKEAIPNSRKVKWHDVIIDCVG